IGFAEGVNGGIRRAIDLGVEYVALFNNDAVANKDWLEMLVKELDKKLSVGIATCKFLNIDKVHLDSTGDLLTIWGLPYPRGRGEKIKSEYDNDTIVFGATGGASIYRVSMLREIGLFDKDFFAYYEDVDISFRAQLSGWEVSYVPTSVAYHEIGATSKRIKGFTTYQTMKNLPWILWKDVPIRYFFRVGWRFYIAYTAFFLSAARRGQIWPAFKGASMSALLLPKKIVQRWHIQSTMKVPPEYIWSILTHDLPPNAYNLRVARDKWRNFISKDVQ
ncbi:MAG TPA: glycosyltransferase family 2 protein, partial [Bacteroidia bacterium]|nr:glycosyltransferase family 2 protein [Bacteroidia bacterium]